jgi:hypothetical protein
MSLHIGYVLTNTGRVMVQLPDDGAHGFALADGEQYWPGGLGAAQEWEALRDDDPRITEGDRQQLQWLLDEAAPHLALPAGSYHHCGYYEFAGTPAPRPAVRGAE